MKYRMKPVIVDAFKWTGDQNQTEEPEWILEAIKKKEVHFRTQGTLRQMLLDQGSQIAQAGDYVVMDEHGDMSAYSPEGFEATYEEVEESPEADRDK